MIKIIIGILIIIAASAIAVGRGRIIRPCARLKTKLTATVFGDGRGGAEGLRPPNISNLHEDFRSWAPRRLRSHIP